MVGAEGAARVVRSALIRVSRAVAGPAVVG